MRVIIRKIDKPLNNDIESVMAWLCQTFEFDAMEALILRSLIKAARSDKGMTSLEISKEINRLIGRELPRTTVLYHINKLMEAGMIVKNGRSYYIRGMNLINAIDQLSNDVKGILNDMKEMLKLLEVNGNGR
ncbi:MAG: hypothetical protein ARM1_0137 [Candidatus Micrarchaeota archaeon]|nr:MAG: hypothetical protein ARM1_0137 [Candidatus Micrarchaeota archaeon]